MSKTKVAVNGMGRIGRTILRELAQRENAEIEIVAVNNPGKMKNYLHLLKYDSVHGVFDSNIEIDDENHEFSIDGQKICFFTEKDPSKIPWDSLGVEIVIDCTGVFRDKDSLSKHIGGSVKKVILCAPGKNMDKTIVMGINHEEFNPEIDNVVSNASCTTNCLAPVAKVIHDHFEIESGYMTTVHSFTADQNLLDGSHSDMRRARAATVSMIPTTTGAAKAVGEVIPELNGKLDGFAVRVPTPNVSLVDLSVVVKKKATIGEINSLMKKASQESLKGILRYTDEELVSADFMGMKESSCFDSLMTNVIGNNLKLVAWYDNEAGFSNRVIDLAGYIGSKI